MTADLSCDWTYSHVWITPSGRSMPCCVFDGTTIELGDPRESRHMQDFLHGKTMTRIRASMRDGRWDAGCGACQAIEGRGQPSMRQQAPEEIAGHRDIRLRYLEISVGRICDCKCRSCSPWFSTLWEHETRAKGDRTIYGHRDCNDQPLDLFGDVSVLKITGGEPFLNPPFLRLLESLHDAGHAAHIKLIIHTNCNRFPDDRFIAALGRFKSVQIRLSIDAFGKRNEFIRSGSIWSQTEATALRWGRLRQGDDRVDIVICSVISCLNILDLQNLWAWIDTMRTMPGLDQLRANPTVLQNPSYLSILHLPADLRHRIADGLQDTGDDWDHTRGMIRAMLDNSMSSTKTHDFSEILQHMAELDATRPGEHSDEMLAGLLQLAEA